jgi:site-specific recombinase XerC
VNNQTSPEKPIGPKTPSSIELVDRDKPIPIRDWQQKYERYLFLIGRKATQERYARALERFLGKHPGMTYGHQFLRPVINDYVQGRLREGASVATVRLEMSAVRGLFQFALDMGAADVFFNPAKGVKVRKSNRGLTGANQNKTQ